jgi:hypothetical protein
MVVSAHDLPGARLRRWGYHVGLGVASFVAIWIAVNASAAAKRAGREQSAARRSLTSHTEAADQVAADCDLDPFSHEAALEHYPIEIPDFPTRQERECIERVTNARADLIDDHLLLEQLEPEVAETARAAQVRVIVASLLVLLWVAGLFFGMILPRLRGAPGHG